MTDAYVLQKILDPDGKGYTDFDSFCKHFDAVQMVRCSARLKAWHRTFGLGVAGNVAGHMAQAGEAEEPADGAAAPNLPAAVFTYYAPHPHTVDATEEEQLEMYQQFPVSQAVIEFPRLKGSGNVQ